MYKIVFFAKDIRGGTDTFLRQMNLLDKNKYKLYFCFYKRDLYTKYGKGRIVLNEYFPEKRIFIFTSSLIFLKNLLKSYFIIKSEKPDILFSCDTYSFTAISLIKLVCFRKTPLVSLVNNNIYLINKKRRGVLKTKIVFMVIRVFSGVPDVFVFVSKHLANLVVRKIKIQPKTVSIIPHSVDLSLVKRLAKEELTSRERKLFEESSSDYKIISHGRLDDQKDFQTLLKAFSLVVKTVPKCKLIILGDGEQRSELERQTRELRIEKKVVFVGWQKNVFKFLKHGDLYVLSSHYEGFPMALLEGMSCGLPVVSTDSPTGPREILGNSRYGILTPVGDYERLALTLLRILQNKNIRNQYRKLSLYRSKKFTTTKMLKDYELVFQRFL